MAHYPLFLNIKGKLCLVVGAGNIAARKIESLLECRADVLVVAPRANAEVHTWAKEQKLRYEARPFEEADLEGVFMLIAGTDDPALNARLFPLCEARNILINCIDDPAFCRFIVPSVMRRGDLQMAVSTGGAGPRLARNIRLELEERFGPEYGKYVALLKSLRPEIQSELPDYGVRSRLYDALGCSDMLELLRLGQDDEAEALARRILGEFQANSGA